MSGAQGFADTLQRVSISVLENFKGGQVEQPRPVKGKRAAQASSPGGRDVRQHAATADNIRGQGKGKGTQQPGNGRTSQPASQGQHSPQAGGPSLEDTLSPDSANLALGQGSRPFTSPRPHLLPLPTPDCPGAPRSPRLKTSGASSARGPPSARSAASPTPMQQKGSIVRVTATPGPQRDSMGVPARSPSTMHAAEGGQRDSNPRVGARSSMAVRESVMALLGAQREAAHRIEDGTPTIVPPSDRQAIMQVLEQSPPQRGCARELAPVLRVLHKVPFLGELEAQALTEIARWVRYQYLEPGQVVFSQGDVGNLFYIIASGRVVVGAAPAPAPAPLVPATEAAPPAGANPGQLPAGQSAKAQQQDSGGQEGTAAAGARPSDAAAEVVLEAGSTFGEKALTKAGLGKRSATVVTQTQCELLTLDIHQYQALLAKVHEEELMAKVEVLRGFELTAEWTEQQLRDVASVLTVRKFPADKVVVHQGSPSTNLLFIKLGEVRVVRHLPSNQRLRRLMGNAVMAAQFQPGSRLRDRLKDTALSQTHSGSQLSSRTAAVDLYHHMLPYEEALGGAEDVYVEIATLGPHEIFGEVGAPEGTWCQASIVTTTYTELLQLTRHDLLTRLKSTCRLQLEGLREKIPSDEVLLESLAKDLEWQRYKHRLIAGALWESSRLSRMVDYHKQGKQGAGGASGSSQQR